MYAANFSEKGGDCRTWDEGICYLEHPQMRFIEESSELILSKGIELWFHIVRTSAWVSPFGNHFGGKKMIMNKWAVDLFPSDRLRARTRAEAIAKQGELGMERDFPENWQIL